MALERSRTVLTTLSSDTTVQVQRQYAAREETVQITHVEVIPVELSLRFPFRTAYSDKVDRVAVVFVRLETLQGEIAWGCAAFDTAITGETLADVTTACRACADCARDLHPLNIEYALAELAPLTEGTPSALCAFDIAFHDLLGLAAGLSLYRLLGGYRDRIQTSITLSIAPLKETVELGAGDRLPPRRPRVEHQAGRLRRAALRPPGGCYRSRRPVGHHGGLRPRAGAAHRRRPGLCPEQPQRPLRRSRRPLRPAGRPHSARLPLRGGPAHRHRRARPGLRCRAVTAACHGSWGWGSASRRSCHKSLGGV